MLTGISAADRGAAEADRAAKLGESDTGVTEEVARQQKLAMPEEPQVDVLLVNPPSPDGRAWVRAHNRAGCRTWGNAAWPQTDLAQMAALLAPDYTLQIVDAIAARLRWPDFERLLRVRRPRYYLTQVAGPTLTNDMRGVFLARSLGAVTVALGTHVTVMTREVLGAFPGLDYVLRGEPELTLRELIDTLEVVRGRWYVGGGGRLIGGTTGKEPEGHRLMWKLWSAADPGWQPAWGVSAPSVSDKEAPPWLAAVAGRRGGDRPPRPSSTQLASVKGLGWRSADEIRINPDRPYCPRLDDLPLPQHHLLPLERYRMPMVPGPCACVVASRGCPAGCRYCIKEVSYDDHVRLRSPEKIVAEMRVLRSLGVRHVHMCANHFTVSRDQVAGLCLLLRRVQPGLLWTCNSRVDSVDEELLVSMRRAGCVLVVWGIESGSEAVLKRAGRAQGRTQVETVLAAAKKVGIKNWGDFILGLPGETEATIADTIALAKTLPLDFAEFHLAVPYPGTPLFDEAVQKGWLGKAQAWSEIDMERVAALEYVDLGAEDLRYWKNRAFRACMLRPRPLWNLLKGMRSRHGFRVAVDVALEILGWGRD